MALSSKHPSYARYITDWQLMRHAYEGERVVKAQGTLYLPATAGQVLDGQGKAATSKGQQDYDAYKLRAVFPDYVSDAVEQYIGLLQAKPAEIELPTRMEPLLEKATIDGESLQTLLRRINEQQLVTGRLGLLVDLPPNADPGALPYIALYVGESIGNWDESNDHEGINALSLVVLDESSNRRMADFEWKQVERYRVLQLLPPEEKSSESTQLDGEPTSPDATEDTLLQVYKQGVFEIENGEDYSPALMFTPMYRGAPLLEIPFVFINSKDIIAEPDNPPLLGLGRRCMTIYRGEADYRYTLYMQSQDTLVIIGNTVRDDELRVGAGAKIDVDVNGDAKYIGVGAEGIEHQRLALEDDRKIAETKAGVLISPTAGKQESGDALSTRLSGQTASLRQIAMAGAKGLENALRKIAVWIGEDPEKVTVKPNLEFVPVQLTGQEVSSYMAARTLGAPLSLKSLHGVFVNKGLTKMTYEEELDTIAEEDADRAARVATLPQPPAPPAPAPRRE